MADDSAKRRKTVLTAVATTVGVAVVGATASALITPELFSGWLHPTPTPTPAALEFKTVSTSNDAVTVTVVDEWMVLDGTYDVVLGGDTDLGSALNAGTRIDSGTSWNDDWLYVAASSDASLRLGLADQSDAELADWVLEEARAPDWTRENCVLTEGPELEKSDWVIGHADWKNCGTVEGSRFWEIVAVSPDRSVVVVIQSALAPGTPDAAMLAILEGLAVNPAKLPHATSGDQVLP